MKTLLQSILLKPPKQLFLNMTVSQFNQFDEAEQLEAVWDGKHIGNRQDAQHNILLYKLNGIFVEVYYNREFNALIKFVPHETKEDIMPFLGYYVNL